MRLTEEEAKALGFKKDGKGNWQTNIQRDDSGKVPELESSAVKQQKDNDAVKSKDAGRGIGGNQERFRIVVTARCRRHTDPDNLCPKWFIDQLRAVYLIPDDSSEYIEEVVKRVRKVESWEPETTMIEVWEL